MSIYKTGTISIPDGSTAVTGVGTTFTGNVMAGDVLVCAGQLAVIADVPSDTAITLVLPWSGAVSGAAYTVVQTGTGWSKTLAANEQLVDISVRLG